MRSGLHPLAAPSLQQQHLDHVVIEVAVDAAPRPGGSAASGGARRFDAAALRAEMLAELRALSYDDAATSADGGPGA